MTLKENVSLAQYTTFKIGGPARFFCVAKTEADLLEAVTIAHRDNLRIMVIGGGSNLLISDAGFGGLVIKNEIMGKKVIPSGDGSSIITAGAGELWDELVDLAVDYGLYGLENLSAIPGTVGAAPVQNIGAYGFEVADFVVCVRALDVKKMKFVDFSNRDCRFGYRDSVFKHHKGRYLISHVDFRLFSERQVNIEYADLKNYFQNDKPSLKQVREAVINIRWKKLPDWKLWGTAGSFFKNPVISKLRFNKLKQQYPDLPSYPESLTKVKVPLGWVLDHICHMKGKMEGNVGTYEKQALVTIAKPGATAAEVVSYTQKIMNMVLEKTGIKIEAEVEWVN